jgi:hypothetical protein
LPRQRPLWHESRGNATHLGDFFCDKSHTEMSSLDLTKVQMSGRVLCVGRSLRGHGTRTTTIDMLQQAGPCWTMDIGLWRSISRQAVTPRVRDSAPPVLGLGLGYHFPFVLSNRLWGVHLPQVGAGRACGPSRVRRYYTVDTLTSARTLGS